jgi:hypothetical protein
MPNLEYSVCTAFSEVYRLRRYSYTHIPMQSSLPSPTCVPTHLSCRRSKGAEEEKTLNIRENVEYTDVVSLRRYYLIRSGANLEPMAGTSGMKADQASKEASTGTKPYSPSQSLEEWANDLLKDKQEQ